MISSSSSLSKREYRIDFLRGLALLFIFINHTPGNFFAQFTPARFGFSDSAELFVLLAGFASSQAYYPLCLKGEWKRACLKIGSRVKQLYLWHVTTALLAVGIVFLAAVFLNVGYAHDSVSPLYLNVAAFFNSPLEGILGIVILGHQLGYFNILPMYMVLLLMLPIVMSIAQKSYALLALCSVTLWAVSGFFLLDLPNYPTEGGWYFNPFAWQMIFVFGFLLGRLWKEGVVFPKRLRWLKIGCLCLSIAYLVLSCWVVVTEHWNWFLSLFPSHFFFWSFDKTYVALPRFLHLLSLVVLIVWSPLWKGMKDVSVTNPLVVMGKNALPVFSVGTVCNLISAITRLEAGGGLLVDSLIMTLQFSCLLLFAYALEKYKGSKETGDFLRIGVPPLFCRPFVGF